MQFIETVTAFGDDVLVPVNRIKYINYIYNNGYRIVITSDDGSWEECFAENDEIAQFRYQEIKRILNAKQYISLMEDS